MRVSAQVERTVLRYLRTKQVFGQRGITAKQIKHKAFKVAGLGNIHRRARGFVCVSTAANAVNAGAEKLVQHIVFVGGGHQGVHGQAHHAGHMACAHVAKVAARHREAYLLAVGRGGLEIASKVVHHLGQQARPVDGIDGTDFVFGFEVQIVGYRFDQILAIVKHAIDGDVVDVLVHQAEHLRLLERAHAAVRAGHEHAHALFATHGVFGCAAGVATGRAKNIQLFTTARQLVFKQIAQQLHGHVFECERRAIRQRLDPQAIF